MKYSILFIAFLVTAFTAQTQTLATKLDEAYKAFLADPQLKYATSSLYIIDAKTGKVVFGKNQLAGLAPASTQKVITSVTVLDMLGKDFRFKTQLGYDGSINGGKLDGHLYVIGEGDPTLGSWRWAATKDSTLLTAWAKAVTTSGIHEISKSILSDWTRFSAQTIPDGWIWEDLGNYYGAAAGVLNWKENQLDLTLRSGPTVGGKVEVVNGRIDFINELKADKAGTGDNAYAFLPIQGAGPILTGTIPVNQSSFKISIADPDPSATLLQSFAQVLKSNGVEVSADVPAPAERYASDFSAQPQIIHTTYSPSLDSIIYWFNRKSINLYGEALLKVLGFKNNKKGSTAEGLSILKSFWKGKGIPGEELNMYDGSGLSPLNRVTTRSQVEILKYARSRPWFTDFYNALPEYNGMKMKSGTISDVKGFCGYHKARDGKEYIFSFLVNNYSGKSSLLVGKMYGVLDLLK